MIAPRALGLLFAVSMLACRPEKPVEIAAEGSSVPAKRPVAVELPEASAAPATPAPHEAPSEAPTTDAPSVSPEPGAEGAPPAAADEPEAPFPLPVLEGSKLLRTVKPAPGAVMSTRQLTIETGKTMAEAATYYEQELARLGYKSRRNDAVPGKRIMVSGEKGEESAFISVLQDPASKQTVVALTWSKHNKGVSLQRAPKTK